MEERIHHLYDEWRIRSLFDVLIENLMNANPTSTKIFLQYAHLQGLLFIQT